MEAKNGKAKRRKLGKELADELRRLHAEKVNEVIEYAPYLAIGKTHRVRGISYRTIEKAKSQIAGLELLAEHFEIKLKSPLAAWE